jgi:uncharacterized protein with HEPN domain
MRREVRKYLHDIQRAAMLLQDFTRGRTFEGYAGDPLLRAAVERKFEIVGEALSRLAKIDAEVAARISEHRRIIGFRNLLIHGYADVDDSVVWDILESKLPLLTREVEALLEE